MRAKLTAEVIQKFEPRTGNRSDGTTWCMQNVLVKTTGEQYPKDVVFLFRDTPELKEGKVYDFDYEVSARLYNGRWYNDVSCFRYQEHTEGEKAAPATKQPVEKQAGENNELPF